MDSPERVRAVLRHETPDRMPRHGWVKANLREKLIAALGSVSAFEDKYDFDMAHLFGGPNAYAGDLAELPRNEFGELEPATLLDYKLKEVNDEAEYSSIKAQVQEQKVEKGRFVYVQTPGIFECLNRAFGIETHLTHLAVFAADLQEVYRRQAEWNRTFAMNCLDLGVDMIHVSDDWGSQTGLMFSPETWWELIYPNHKITCDAVKARGAYLSLHSDGNITSVLDGVVKLGYDVLHPYQESAGMSYDLYLQRYRDTFTIMGGLDIQTTLGFGKLAYLRSEIERILGLFSDKRLLLCTSHMVQEHCEIDELSYAYDIVRELCDSV